MMVSENRLLPVLNTSLPDLYLVPYLVVGFYQSVGEIGVNAVAYHLPFEGLECGPFSVIALGIDLHLHVLVHRLLKECFPVVEIELQVLSVACSGQCVVGIVGISALDGENGFDVGEVLVANLEIERGDIHRNRYICIVGIHIGVVIYLFCILVSLGAGGEQKKARRCTI